MRNIIYIGPERQFSDIRAGTVEECAQWLSTLTAVGLDTETSGLDFTCEKAVLLQLGTSEVQYCIDVRYMDISLLRPYLESQDLVKIGHNIKFDYKFLMNMGIRLENVWDTMLSEQVLHCGRKHDGYGLKDVAAQYLGLEVDKSERNLFIHMVPGQLYTDRQLVYGAGDVEGLVDIMNRQREHLIKENLLQVTTLENRATLAFADIEYNGLHIDPQEWLSISKEEKVELHRLRQELDRILYEDQVFSSQVPTYIQGDLFEEPRKVDTEWDSPKQVLQVMHCIIPDLESVEAPLLFPHRKKHPMIETYLRYKEVSKVVSSYGEAFLRERMSDGMIHTSFRQILNTGRVSSKEPNMQQIPADNRFRNCFKAPSGHVFVSSDFSSQELNVLAFGSQDPVWLQALRNGWDLHSVCAELVFKERWHSAADPDCLYLKGKEKCDCKGHKKLRNQVKVVNFGLAYGMSPNKLSSTIEVSLEEARSLIDEYFKAFPAIGKYLDDLGKFGLHHGYSLTLAPFRRKRFYPGWSESLVYERSSESRQLCGKIERAGKNLPIQGSSADMVKLALVLIRTLIHSRQLPVKLVMTVHDQIDTVCERSFSEEWARLLTAQMEKAARTVITNGLLKSDTTITEHWSK